MNEPTIEASSLLEDEPKPTGSGLLESAESQRSDTALHEVSLYPSEEIKI